MGGVVDGIFGKKQKTTTRSSFNNSGSVAPTNPQYVSDAIQGFTDRIGQYGQINPKELAAGASGLQNQAFAGAQGLGGWKVGNQNAQNMVMGAVGAGPNLAQASGYTAPTIARAQLGPAVGANVPTLGGPALATSQRYNPLTMTAEQATAQGYNPLLNTNVAQASGQGYDAAQAQASLVGPASLAAASLAGPAAQAQAVQAQASRARDFMGDYINPFTQQVVDSTLADFDENAGVLRAQQAAGAARNKAFGGSRYGLQEAQTEGELARARAATAGNLRSDAFKFGAQMGDSDATRLTTTSGLNAQLGTQTNQLNAGETNQNKRVDAQLGTQVSQFNAGETNANNRTNAELGTRTNIANTGFTNDARQFGANAANTASIANTGFTNQNNWNNQNAFNRAAEFGANAGNTASIANTGFRQQAGLANMEAGNRASEFGANAANQVGLANVGAQNQFGLAQFGANVDAAENLAAVQNQYGLAGYQGDLQTNLAQGNIDARAAEFGQDALNLNSRFNAGQQEAALGRQMQGAGLLGDLANAGAANGRADLGMVADLGGIQRQIEQDQRSAPGQQLALMGQLYGQAPYGLFNGKTTTSSGSERGRSIGMQRDSLFDIGLQLAALSGSERRVKKDIEKVGALPNGLNVYDFRYLWDADDGPRHRGVMVDEVEMIQPEALGPVVRGIQTVDYSKIEGWA